MRKLLVLLLLAGCRRDGDAATATVAPAEPRPAPTVTATLGERPMITTSGSPPPERVVAPGTQAVTVSASGISMQTLLPRAHTAFLIENETALPHDLLLRGGNGPGAAVAVPAAGRAVLQMRITAAAYELVCTTPGHSERAAFTTYRPGAPMNGTRR